MTVKIPGWADREGRMWIVIIIFNELLNNSDGTNTDDLAQL